MSQAGHATQQLRLVCIGLHPGIIQSMLDYDYLCGASNSKIVAIIAGNRKSERFFWGEDEVSIPVYPTVAAVPEEVRDSAEAAINFHSGRRVLSSSEEAFMLLPQLKYYSVFAEQVPESHALHLSAAIKSRGIIATGPASVGMLLPGLLKLGAIGGTGVEQIASARISIPGDVAIISTSGGMINELINAVTG